MYFHSFSKLLRPKGGRREWNKSKKIGAEEENTTSRARYTSRPFEKTTAWRNQKKVGIYQSAYACNFRQRSNRGYAALQKSNAETSLLPNYQLKAKE